MDERGNKTENTYTGADGTQSRGISEHVYDEYGFLSRTREFVFNEDGGRELASETSREYDEHHNLVGYYSHRDGQRTRLDVLRYECSADVFERMPRRQFTERTVETVEGSN